MSKSTGPKPDPTPAPAPTSGAKHSHDREKTKLINRLRRMRGQLEAMERELGGECNCTKVLQQATACRGALDGFIAEVIEDHIRQHVVPPGQADSPQAQAAEELIEIVHSYLT